jgi:hypothetical protein
VFGHRLSSRPNPFRQVYPYTSDASTQEDVGASKMMLVQGGLPGASATELPGHRLRYMSFQFDKFRIS